MTAKKYTVNDGELKFTEPVNFDDIYDATVGIIIEMYPRTEDLLEALCDMTYDEVVIDFRQWFIDTARDQGMYRK